MADISRHELRKLLNHVFRTDSDLRAFILDNFAEVYREVSSAMDRTAIINLLFLYFDTNEIVAALRANPSEQIDRYLKPTTQTRGELEPENNRAPELLTQGPKGGAIKVVCLYEPTDSRFFRQLELHLTVWTRNELITLWHPQRITPGVSVAEAYRSMTSDAEIVIVLVSPDFLAHETDMPWFQAAFDRWKRGEVQLLPILVRPTLLDGTKLSLLQRLPRSGHAISLSKNADETWVEVMQDLKTAFEYRSHRAIQVAQPPTRHGVEVPAVPQKRYGIQDIFVLSGFPEHTFVEPVQFRQILPQLRHMGMGLIIEGPSGIGKTTMVRKALEQIGAKNLDRQWIRCTDEDSLAELDKLLSKPFTGYLVLDDFHYLDDERVKKVANKLHAVATAFPAATAKMIFIGVQQVGRRLLHARPDLGHRSFSISVARQPAEKLAEMISRGEEFTNIQFQHRAEMIQLAGGSFSILQLLCFKLATSNGVDRTQLVTKVIKDSPAMLLPEIMAQLEGEFDRPLIELVKTKDVPRWGAAALALLWLLSHSDDDIVNLEDARLRFPVLHVAFDLLHGERLTRIITDSDQLGRWLHYDGDSRLSLHDPRLGFYLRHLKWSSFIERSGLSGISLTLDGKLEIGPSAPTRMRMESLPRLQPEATLSPFPETLLRAVRQGLLIPLIGSGVSGDVRRTKSKEALFPTLKELVTRAADCMTRAGQGNNASILLAMRDEADATAILEAVVWAQGTLPAAEWRKLLKEQFDPDLSEATRASLMLPKALWTLGSSLMITTTYDRLLEWSCQQSLGVDAKVANIAPPDQLGELLRHQAKRPVVWHVFGSIFDLTTLIFRADGPELLIPEKLDRKPMLDAALLTLRSLLAEQTFLFIGHSFAAANSWLESIFKDATGPHYAVVPGRELKRARERFRHLPLEFISSSNTNKSLVMLIEQLAEHRQTRGPHA